MTVKEIFLGQSLFIFQIIFMAKYQVVNISQAVVKSLKD